MLMEALEYFKAHSAYKHLFLLFKNKYESLGRIGGTVNLDGFNDDHFKSVGLFLGVTSKELKMRGKVSLLAFEKQLQRTKFGEVSLLELLEGYFEEKIISRKERKLQKESLLAVFFEELEGNFPSLKYWLAHIRKRTRDTYWIYRLIEKDSSQFEGMAKYVESGLKYLPSNLERLPMFSQRITDNPHAFDLNTDLGKLFIHALTIKQQKNIPFTVPADSEGLNALLLDFNILRDDITNYVTCINLLAESEQGLHPMWKGAAELHSVLNAPLREISPLKRVYPTGDKKVVWIIENSGVYSSLVDQLPHIPFICTHGQFKLAALLLIDLLIKEGCTLYYAGDIDPEGINMTDRLIQRHPEHVRPWKMDIDAYRKSVSSVVLSEERLKKIDVVMSEELKAVVAEVAYVKRAAYQEALVGEMVEELGRNFL